MPRVFATVFLLPHPHRLTFGTHMTIPMPQISGSESDNILADRFFTLGNIELSLGGQLSSAQLCYVTLGTLNAAGDNAILILHGYTSSHRFILANDPDSAEGSWGDLIGPGKAIDTDRFFIIAPNALGSSYGSTGPGSDNPVTNTPYGPDFPALQFEDMVTAQYRLLKHLGVTHLTAVIGLSMGGFGAFQWAVQHPDFMNKVVPVLSAPWGSINAKASQNSVHDRLKADPHWNDGWYYQKPLAMQETLTRIRTDTLIRYGVPAWLNAQYCDPEQVQAKLELMAQRWAARFDANAMVVLRHAINRFDARASLRNIKADVLYVLCDTDQLFSPEIANDTLDPLKAAGHNPTYVEIESSYGHYASSLDWQKWARPLTKFLAHDTLDV